MNKSTGRAGGLSSLLCAQSGFTKGRHVKQLEAAENCETNRLPQKGFASSGFPLAANLVCLGRVKVAWRCHRANCTSEPGPSLARQSTKKGPHTRPVTRRAVEGGKGGHSSIIFGRDDVFQHDPFRQRCQGGRIRQPVTKHSCHQRVCQRLVKKNAQCCSASRWKACATRPVSRNGSLRTSISSCRICSWSRQDVLLDKLAEYSSRYERGTLPSPILP